LLFPVFALMTARYPEWATLYWWPNASEHRTWLIVALPLVGWLFSAAGYLAGAQAARKREGKYIAASILVLTGGAGVFVFLTGERWWRVGRAENLASAPTLPQIPEGLFLVLAVPILLGGVIYLLALFAVEGNKIERASRQVVLPISPVASSQYSSAATSPSGRGLISPSELEQLAQAIPPTSAGEVSSPQQAPKPQPGEKG